MKRKETPLTGKQMAYARMRGLHNSAVKLHKMGREIDDIGMIIAAGDIMHGARCIGDIIAAAEANGWDR